MAQLLCEHPRFWGCLPVGRQARAARLVLENCWSGARVGCEQTASSGLWVWVSAWVCWPSAWIEAPLAARFCDEWAPSLFSFGLPFSKQRLLVAKFLGTRCVRETISGVLEKCTLSLCMVKAAGAAFSLQNLPVPSVVGNSGARGAGGSDPQVFTWSSPVSTFKRTRPGSDFWICLQPPPFVGRIFYQSKEQDCFYSSGVLLPLSLPSAAAGIRKGRGCRGWWDKACLKACAQLGQHFFLMFGACDPFHSFLQLQSKIWKYYI